jgi:Caspase domain
MSLSSLSKAQSLLSQLAARWAVSSARLRRLIALFALSLASLLPSLAQAPVDLRVALVIGNAAYPGNAALINPTNDAKAMGEVLRGLGFSVVETRDASRAQMNAAIAQVRDKLRGKQGVGMLYYAGHGLQLDWRNYMVPVDAKISTASDVPTQSIDINQVLEAFKQAGTRMNILVLDACRDNPYSSANAKGLAQMDALPGTFLAYATAPGNVAEDGTGSNGLYTSYLLQELKKPQARIEDVFKRVRLHVRQKSNGRQIPWESTSLEDDFVFNSGVLPLKQQSLSERDLAFIEERTAWDRVKDTRNVDDIYGFLQKFPNGEIAEIANFQLATLQRAKTRAAASKDGVIQLEPGAPRYKLGDTEIMLLTNNLTKSTQRLTRTVIKETTNTVEISNGDIFDQMGNNLSNFYGRKEPSKMQVPSDLYIGKKWRTSYSNIPLKNDPAQQVFWDYQVVDFETIQVPAGSFKVFRIFGKGKSTVQLNVISENEETIWVDPKTMLIVKSNWSFRNKGRVTTDMTKETIEFKLVPR